MNILASLRNLIINTKQQEYNQQVSQMLLDSRGELSLEFISPDLLRYIIDNSFLLSPDDTINIGNTLCRNARELYSSRFAEIQNLMPGALLAIYERLREHFPDINSNMEASTLELSLQPIVSKIVREGEIVNHPEQ